MTLSIENQVIVQKTKEPQSKKITFVTTDYQVVCTLDDLASFQELDSQIMDETKVRILYTTKDRPKGYYPIEFIRVEKGRRVEINFSRHKLQYYGRIERV